MVSFEVQKYLILMEASLSFFKIASAVGVVANKSSPNLRSQDLLLWFSLRVF